MADKDLTELKATITSTKALITHLLNSLKQPPTTTLPSGEKPLNALALASTVASLIHAQATKLTLLVVNKPFTPTAITRIIKTLASECIPALASAAQLSAAPRYPSCVRAKIVDDAQAILLEFQSLIELIPVDERGVEQTQSRGTFSYTGVIWAVCERLKDAGADGASGIAAIRAQGFLGLVKDALEELREWRESGEEAAAEEEQESDEEDDSDEDSLDMMMDSKCPAKMLPVAGALIEVIDHVRLLYPPLIKRRVRRFPALNAITKEGEFPTEEQVKRLNELLGELEKMHDEVDQAAFVLYEKGVDTAMEQLKKLGDLSEQCASSMAQNWLGEEDELTAWIKEKYLPKLRELKAVQLPAAG